MVLSYNIVMPWWIIAILVVLVLLLLCFLLSIANFSGERFMERYQQINNILLKSELTPIDFIAKLNLKYFAGKLQIIQVSTVARDAYSKGKLFLSSDTIKRPSLASFTIIAHEMGHALQDLTGTKLKHLVVLRRLGRTLGFLMLPCIIAGIVLMIIGQSLFIAGAIVAGFGVLLFFLALFIKLRTIAIEKDASKNALKFLGEFLSEDEVKKCKAFLNDARLTYWADFLRACLGWTAMSRKTKLFN